MAGASLTIIPDSLTNASVNGKRIMAVTRLNTVWKIAIPVLSTVFVHSSQPGTIRYCITDMASMNIIVPRVLNRMWTTPVRFASLEHLDAV